jgi:hypothetical protein
MEYKEAISILLEMMKRHQLDSKEKEAIRLAIGTLDCGSLGENRVRKIIKGKKEKIEKDKKA